MEFGRVPGKHVHAVRTVLDPIGGCATTPAVINWLGKHGWTLIQFVPIGDTDAVLTKPWSKID